ncbi:MAG: DUF5677 domain-containing protein [Ignavibacteriales bacterium]
MPESATQEFARMIAQAIGETASLLQGRGMSSDHEFIAQFVLGKSATSYAAVRHLCQEGFGPDALMIARTIFENAINLAYINRRPEERSRRFLEFEHVEEYRQIEALKKAFPGKRVVTAGDEERITDEYEAVKHNYKGASWSGETMHAMAMECGLGPQYALIYRLASGFVHGGPRSVHTYIERQAGHYDVRLGAPDEEFTDRALLSAGMSVLIVLEEVCRAYGEEPPGEVRAAQSMAGKIGQPDPAAWEQPRTPQAARSTGPKDTRHKDTGRKAGDRPRDGE